MESIQRENLAGDHLGIAIGMAGAQLGIIALAGKLAKRRFLLLKIYCPSLTLIGGIGNAWGSHQRAKEPVAERLQEAWENRYLPSWEDLVEIHEGVLREDIGPQHRAEVKALNRWLEYRDDMGGLELAEPRTFLDHCVSYFLLPARRTWTVATEVILYPILGLMSANAHANMNPASEDVNKDQPPIILVHGRGSNQGIWRHTRALMNRWGYDNIYSLNLDDNLLAVPANSFEEYEERLEALIDEALAATGQQKAILVGHSMGGLLSVRAARSGKVQAVMTLASPLGGTDLLGLAPEGKLTGVDQAMLPSSRQVQEAQAFLRGTQMPVYTVSSGGDWVVYTRDGETEHVRGGDPRRQHRLRGWAGHKGVAFAPGTMLKVHGWLKREIPREE